MRMRSMGCMHDGDIRDVRAINVRLPFSFRFYEYDYANAFYCECTTLRRSYIVAAASFPPQRNVSENTRTYLWLALDDYPVLRCCLPSPFHRRRATTDDHVHAGRRHRYRWCTTDVLDLTHNVHADRKRIETHQMAMASLWGENAHQSEHIKCTRSARFADIVTWWKRFIILCAMQRITIIIMIMSWILFSLASMLTADARTLTQHTSTPAVSLTISTLQSVTIIFRLDCSSCCRCNRSNPLKIWLHVRLNVAHTQTISRVHRCPLVRPRLVRLHISIFHLHKNSMHRSFASTNSSSFFHFCKRHTERTPNGSKFILNIGMRTIKWYCCQLTMNAWKRGRESGGRGEKQRKKLTHILLHAIGSRIHITIFIRSLSIFEIEKCKHARLYLRNKYSPPTDRRGESTATLMHFQRTMSSSCAKNKKRCSLDGRIFAQSVCLRSR